MGGLSATAMYAAGEVAGKASARRLMGAMAMYKGNGFAVGAGYNTRNNELGDKSLTTATLGALVDIGPGTLSGQYTTVKDDNPTDMTSIGAALSANAATAPVAGLVQNAFTQGFRQDARLFQIGSSPQAADGVRTTPEADGVSASRGSRRMRVAV